MDPNLSSQYSQKPLHPPLGVIIPPPQNPYAPQAGNPNPIVPPNENPRFSSKVIAMALIMIIAAVALPVTVYLTLQQLSSKNEAALLPIAEDTIIAVVAGSNIYKKDLDAIAKEATKAATIDNKALKIALDIAIERKILDLEKKYQNIVISEADIVQKQKETDLSETQSYYEILKNKLILSEVKNWQAFVIGFWIPPESERLGLTAEEKVIAQAQSSNGLKALSEIENQLVTAKDPVEIAQDIADTYPSLKDIIAVNGYLLTDAQNEEILSKLKEPKIYVYEKANVSQLFFDTLYPMDTQGQIKKVIAEDQSGGSVIKLVSANTKAKFDTYASWLSSKKESFVTIVRGL